MVCTRALIAGTKGAWYTNNWCGTGNPAVSPRNGVLEPAMREKGLEKGSVPSFSPLARTPNQRHHLSVLHVPSRRCCPSLQRILGVPRSCCPGPRGVGISRPFRIWPCVSEAPKSKQSPKVWPRKRWGAAAVCGASFFRRSCTV